MSKIALLEQNSLCNVVNVASVPQRSPFRYPGGKTWLVPHVRRWLASLSYRPMFFYEPFAGGGIISLTVAFEGLSEKIIMVELDAEVAAVWRTILSKDNEWLAKRIVDFDLTVENVQREIEKSPTSIRQKAFATLLKNRIYHGGILAPGSGMIKHGENGKGIHSRWYPVTLANRIRQIQNLKDKILFIEGDGLDVIQSDASEEKAVFFIDPPYTASTKRAGSRLYKHHELNHDDLFRMASRLRGDFLLTYDNCPEVIELANKYGLKSRAVAMKNTHHALRNELLIGFNLGWAGESENVPKQGKFVFDATHKAR